MARKGAGEDRLNALWMRGASRAMNAAPIVTREMVAVADRFKADSLRADLRRELGQLNTKDLPAATKVEQQARAQLLEVLGGEVLTELEQALAGKRPEPLAGGGPEALAPAPDGVDSVKIILDRIAAGTGRTAKLAAALQRARENLHTITGRTIEVRELIQICVQQIPVANKPKDDAARIKEQRKLDGMARAFEGNGSSGRGRRNLDLEDDVARGGGGLSVDEE